MEDPHLHSIAEALLHTVLSSKAPSMVKKYLYAFNWWKKWSDDFASITAFPVQPTHLALYLQHLSDTKKSCLSAVYVINWVQA